MIPKSCSASQELSDTERIENPVFAFGNYLISVVLVAILDRNALLGMLQARASVRRNITKAYIKRIWLVDGLRQLILWCHLYWSLLHLISCPKQLLRPT